MSQVLVESLSNNLHIGVTKDLGHYLGVPMITGRKENDMHTYIVDRIRKKLSGWKAKNLSFARRVTLAQSSIMSFPAYVCKQWLFQQVFVKRWSSFVEILYGAQPVMHVNAI